MSEPERRVNRRLTARITCHLTVSYRTNRDWRPATAMDLSPNGCRLRLGEDLHRAVVVFVRFATPAATGLEFEVSGPVIWSRREGLSHQVGIQFSEEPAGLHAVLEALTPVASDSDD